MTALQIVYSEPDLAAPSAIRARPDVVLRPKITARAAFVRLAVDCAAQIAPNAQRMMLSEAPDGPHQFRIGLRRLRTLLKVYRPVLAEEFVVSAREDARRLAQFAERARALDVARLEILPAAANQMTDEAYGALRARLDRAAQKDVTRLRAATETPSFLLPFHARLLGEQWAGQKRKAAEILDAPVRRFARAALEKRWRALRKLGDRIARLTIEERHELRKAGKAMRYTSAFFAPLYPAEQAMPVRNALRRLQNTLGSLNDAAEAGQLSRFAPEQRHAEAIEAVVAVHSARMVEDWPKALKRWRVAAAAEPFWR